MLLILSIYPCFLHIKLLIAIIKKNDTGECLNLLMVKINDKLFIIYYTHTHTYIYIDLYAWLTSMYQLIVVYSPLCELLMGASARGLFSKLDQ